MTGTTDEETFKALVDQLASVGSFDLIMMSFGSGFSMEDTSSANTDKISTLIEYARSHHLEVGGYDLIDERQPTAAEAAYATVDPATNQTTGGGLCFASGWARTLTKDVLTWVENHSLTAIETDGAYSTQLVYSSGYSFCSHLKQRLAGS